MASIDIIIWIVYLLKPFKRMSDIHEEHMIEAMDRFIKGRNSFLLPSKKFTSFIKLVLILELSNTTS
jgi:hypothetical protein